MKDLRRLLAFLGPHWRGIALAVALGVLTIGSGVALMATSAYLISAAALLPSVAELQVAIVAVRFFGLSRGVFRYLERLTSHTVTLQLLADLRVWFYEAIEPLAPARLQAAHSGDLLARAVADVDTLKDFFVRVVAPPLVAIIIAIVFSIFLSFFASSLVLAFLGGMLLVGAAVPLLAHALSRRAQAAWVSARAELTQTVVDHVQGLADLLANNAAARQIQQVDDLAARTAKSEMGFAVIGGLHTALSIFGTHISAWLVLLLAIPLVSAGQLPGVALAVVTLGTQAAFEAVLPFGQVGQLLQAQLASARRLFELTGASTPGIASPQSGQSDPSIVFASPQSGQSNPTTVFASPQSGRSNTQDSSRNNHQSPVLHPSSFILHPSISISIRDLSFAYTPGLPVLRDLSLEVPAGAKIAILGASGIGKTTLLNLLLRFWDYDAGQITIGGVDLHNLPAEQARAYFAVVPQQVHIFNDTLEANLRLAKPDASPEELEGVARRANLLAFIAAQPDGWATMAGEHGLRLSGGERQRLGVARALLRSLVAAEPLTRDKPAPILLLDEFTTHLDAATAASVLTETLAAAQDHTVLLITHSTDGLSAFDAIYEMKDGKLAKIC